MFKSMTAYSRSVLVLPLGRFTVELQSVNRKFLEINTYLPRVLASFDVLIKKWIGQKVRRGQVNARVSVEWNRSLTGGVKPNLALAAQLKDAWCSIAAQTGVSAAEFSLGLLAGEEDLIIREEELQEEGAVQGALLQLMSDALDKLETMKLREGEVLQRDVTTRIDTLGSLIREIEDIAPEVVRKYKDKLLQKLREVLTAAQLQESDERFVKEVCFFADKVDVAEEITRFNSHLAQCRSLLVGREEAIGKTLEFLVQELNREINTIGSKANDAEVAKRVIEIKTELERIREQIQNIE